jgi:CheY-like chemotaxis protein
VTLRTSQRTVKPTTALLTAGGHPARLRFASSAMIRDGNPSSPSVESAARGALPFATHLNPLDGQVGRPTPTGRDSAMSLTGKSALVIEDDADLRRLVELVLVQEGLHVRGASEGTEALRLIEEASPDLIVLDLMLPWVNGIEVLARLRQELHLANVPVIVTTGTATSAFDLRSFAPVHVMHKPLDLPTLVAVAHKLLGPKT